MFKFSNDYLWTNKKQQLAVKQLAKLLVLFNKNVIGINFSINAISSSDFWNHLQIILAAFTSHGRLFQMAAPEYINDLRKSSQFGFGM